MVINAHSVLNSQPLLCFTPTCPLPPFPPFLLALNLSLQHFVTSHCANTNLMMALVIKMHCGERICNTRQEGKIGGAGRV